MKHTLLQRARELRKNLTPQERKLWSVLRNSQIKGYKFKRQVPIGNYIADFVCEEKMLIIEIDGGQHNEIDNIAYDKERTAYLNSRGFNVIRFWNNDVNKNFGGVYETLLEYFNNTPSPNGEGWDEETVL